ncbi:type IV conjugative transfer system protein TraL [Candidatus Protochlamydia sp. R18]|uniref:type IV conjugative transfer system protein TraL n=1 Tax=Candidatus Protochlamydia sp. R18 TaxID=1353977 RepID=UPI0005A770A5|nr:type IV conjugative transfer system protein TraL [Candidatus Protochlamydia sp. R18]
MAQESPRMTCKTFDQSIRILFWSLDEFLILIPLSFVGIFLRSLVLLGLAILLKTLYVQMKKKSRHQPLSHYLYQYFPTSFCQKLGYFEGLPPSHLKKVILT